MTKPCPSEHTLLECARNGTLTAEMKTHLESCSDCRELVAISGLLKAAEGTMPDPRLPDPMELYRKAALKPSPKAAVLLPIWVMHMIAGLTAVLLGGAFLVTGMDAIPDLIQQLSDVLGYDNMAAASQLAFKGVGLATVVLLGLIPVVVSCMWFRDIYRERQLLH